MLHLGDLKGSSADGQGLPADKDGVEVVRQFTRAKKHRREQIYNLLGNHDASPDQWWFKKWVSPTGESIGFLVCGYYMAHKIKLITNLKNTQHIVYITSVFKNMWC